ncbi:MAG: RNA polymerase factor sigma-54 [Alphaproteobacteria bacterium]|nr:RNA polymerase factor sigma-54 [Alphaproteobacteria bacterium]
MAVEMRQVLRQRQSLVMTQQLQQAIKLLQLSSFELNQFVEQEVEKNPLLEYETRLEELRGDVAESRRESEGGGEPQERLVSPGETNTPVDSQYDNMFTNDDRDLSAADDSRSANLDSDNLGIESWSGAGGGLSYDLDEGMDAWENRLQDAPSLRDHLLEQLYLSITDTEERLIGQYLTDQLDEAGYLREEIQEIASRLGCANREVEAVLAKVQQFDPAGVYARDLAECLRLQLADQGLLDEPMKILLANLDAMGEGRMDWLRGKCGAEGDRFASMLATLRRLDPKPGMRFDTTPTEVLIPDVVVSENADGGWVVELNADALPRVLVNRRYLTEVKGLIKTKEEKSFISESLSTANWLVKALDQRARTILKVGEELVRQQGAFFRDGVGHLKPLNLRQIADAIGMHESTVSRVTSNKFLICPRGTFELKYFFTSAIGATEGGDTHSAEAVRHRIRALIENEPPNKTLSDDKIVELLKRDQVDIARRTVAKYREGMNIPSSVERRRLKAAQSL